MFSTKMFRLYYLHFVNVILYTITIVIINKYLNNYYLCYVICITFFMSNIKSAEQMENAFLYFDTLAFQNTQNAN